MKGCAVLMLCLVQAAAVAAEAPGCGPGAAPETAWRQGLAYRNGIEVEKNAALALRCLRQAAQAGWPDAMFTLSHMLAAGEGVDADPAAARRWLLMAAENESPEALQELAMLEADPQRAAQLLRQAAHALGHRARERGVPSR